MSMAVAFLLIVLSITTTLVLLATSLRSRQRKNKYHPVASTIFHNLLNYNRLHDFMTDLAREHRTYRLLSPFRGEVYTSDPANVEYILKTNFENYVKGTYNHDILEDLLGDGIFNVDGEKWREQRKAFSLEFSTRLLREFSFSVFRTNAIKLANIVSEAANSDQPFDIQELFMKSTLDSIFKVAFGFELDSLSGSEEGAKFCKAFDDVSAMSMWRYVDATWKIKRALNIGFESEVRKNVKVMDNFVYKLIGIKTEQMRDSRSHCREDLVSRLMQTDAKPKYLKDVILNFVMAGKDTTATTLSWFIYMLCKNHQVQEKVAEEIEEAMQSHGAADSISGFAASLSEEVLEKMQFLHSTLTETLRLYPPVPVDPKICMSDDTWPDGFHVKKGSLVAYQPYAMGRMKFIWGEDAEEFKPERWLDEHGCFRPESPFKFTAFQAGPRICLGKEFSYRQMKILTAVLLRCFTFRLSDESKLVKYRTMINLHIDGGLTIRAFHRSG